MLAIVQFNKILLLTTGEFRVIDILTGHGRKIKTIDVSLVSKIVVSFSQDLVIVHSPMKDENIMSDHVINSGVLRWKESWRHELKMPVRNINISAIGDFFAISGDGFMSVWNKDSPQLMSYSNLIYYSQKENKNVLANIIKQISIGNVVQQEVPKDGRLIICLEQRARNLKIFYQDKIPKVQEKEKPKEPTQSNTDYRNINRNQYGYKKEEKIENPYIGDNPYADIDNLQESDFGFIPKKESNINVQDLNEYQLPNHRFQIEYFKLLLHDFYESEKRNLPNVILTVTCMNEIFMWQENLMSTTMMFQCVHTFKGYKQTPFFDVCFLEFPPINPKRYVEMKSNVSRLLEPQRDETLKLKKDENQYGIYKENYHETTQDWVLVLNEQILEIYKIDGLRNFPQKSLTISQFNRIKMSYNPKEQALGKWKIDKVALLKRKFIEQVIVHQQMPFVAHLMNNTELYFFIDEQSRNQIIKRPDMKFMGAYSVFHSSKHQQVLNSHLTIKNAKWVKDLCQMVIQFSNNSIALLSSFTQLRILAHSKLPEEYLKLWKEKRSQIAEKWEKLYEIKFEEGEAHEQIVDFEILNTKFIDGGFIIQLAIFTNKNQYMVYETETTFLQNLKTISKTVLLYSNYTTDNMIKLLGACNSFEGENKTVMAVISEIDPLNQPAQLKAQDVAQTTQAPKFQQESESESEEEDIFGNKVKKEKYKPMKKAQPVVETKPVEPLKHQLLLKLIQFTDESIKNKQQQELWRINLPIEYKSKEYKCKYNNEFFGFMMCDGPLNDLFLYIYDLTSNKYIGFLKVYEVLGFKQDISQIDFIFTKGSQKGSISFYSQDSLILVAQSSRDGMPGKWSVIKRYDNVVSLDKQQIRNVQIYESHWRRLIIVINKSYLDIKDKFITNEDDLQTFGDQVQAKQAMLHQIFTNHQKSFALYDSRLLKVLFYKGYVQIVLKILVKLQHTLKTAPQQVTDFLDFDLDKIVEEMEEIQNANKSSAGVKKKQENASSLFDDFYDFGGGGEEKKATDKAVQPTAQLETEFENGFKDFIVCIRAHGKEMGFTEVQKRSYIEFVKKFKQLYRREIQADLLTQILLRKIFLQTEDVEVEMVDQKKEGASGQPFNVADFIQQLRSQPQVSKANVNLIQQWSSFETCLALHSEGQDMIYNELANRFDFDTNLSYDLMKKFCIPIWLKDTNKLRQLAEKVAKVEYRIAGDDFNKSSRAEKTALWYLLANKKNMLLNLYKQEPQQKKVYEFLLQDFSLPKIKTQASKNALALMSKKNYTLSCAFFLMAGYLKDAVQVAIDRIQDPVLAIMIIRLMDVEDSETLKDAYNKYFIERGEQLGDPYLQNIGRWQRKEFLKSVNLFQVDNAKQSNIQHILKHDQTEFNLFFSPNKEEIKNVLSDDKASFVPLASHFDFYVLDVLRVLKKHTLVKRDLQKKWDSGNDGGGDSIFDDFFGSSAVKKEEKKEEVEEEKKLIIDESAILDITTFESSQRGYSLISLVSMTENMEFLEKMKSKYKKLSAFSIITDVIQSLMSSESYFQVQNLGQIIQYLADKMDIKVQEIRQFVSKQLKHNDNLNLIISFLIHEGKEGVMYKVEQEALKLMNFIHSLADFPFITEGIYQDRRGFNVLKMVNFLENLVESYMQVDFQEQENDSALKKDKLDLLPQVSMTYADFENDEENYKITVEEHKGTINMRNLDVQNKMLSQKEVNLNVGLESAFQSLSTKVRTTLIIYISLIQLCYISRKFSLVKSLLVDLRNIMGNRMQENEAQPDDIDLQSLKTKIQKFKYQLSKPKDDDEQDDPYSKMGFTKPTKEEEDLARRKVKMHQFIVLWTRYIITHHVFTLIKFQYDKSQIRGLIDLRSSIIQTRPFNEAVEIIMNPRLVSGELLKKFGSMHRTLENVCTYYFENFLNFQERSLIVDELKKLSQTKYDKSETEHLNMNPLFGNESKFSEFAHYLDLNGFTKHLKDHELSLVYHTNNDYSTSTIQRVQELYESGIDIFRMKGEVLNGFAFDRCDMDLVAIAAQGKGIREIPVKKALLYRTRLNKGHQVIDEEGANWHDSLKKYDKVEQEHKELKPTNDPLIAIIDKLYSYKTVNFTKKPRRTRGTLFLDYEMSPPDLWSGVKSSDFMKSRSTLDITHEDTTSAIESHPHLPVYMSGNQKGMLCLWGFNQQDDKSLDQWFTDLGEVKNINTKKAAIKKIVFSNYGDKVVSSNMDGSVFIHKFEANDVSKTMPIFSLAKSKEQKFNDFDLLNGDSVVALTSLKPKHIWIYDTLIYQRGGLVMESSVGGNIIQPNKSKNQVLVFNEKAGQLNILDIKMNKLIGGISLHNEEVTTVALNETESAMVVGFKDGIVKIYNVDKDYELRESFMAFSQTGNKKGAVSTVKIHGGNGALFAASQTGQFKVLRSKI